MHEQAEDRFNRLGHLGRLIDAAENAAAELERIRMLMEYKLELRVRESKSGDIWVEEERHGEV